MWFVAIGVIATFVLWGTATRYGEKGGPRDAGTLFGKKISFDEFERAFEECRLFGIIRYGEEFSKIASGDKLTRDAWDRLTLLKEAQALKFSVKDNELAQAIASMPLFQNGGKFDQKLYLHIIRHGFRVEPKDFEDAIRNTLLIAKLQEKVFSGVVISPENVKEEYKRLHEKARAAYILVDPKEFREGIEPSGEKLKAFYSAHSDSFHMPEEVEIEYIGLEFSKQEASAGGGLASGENAAKKAAGELSIELVRNPDFEAMAKKYNATFGKSGFFAKGEVILAIGHSPQIADAAFDLKNKEISDPIKTPNGYYIIRLISKREAHLAQFEEAKEAVRRASIDEESARLAKEKALAALSVIKEKLSKGADFTAAAKEAGFEVRATNLFSRGEYIDGISESDEFADAALGLKPKEISGAVKTPTGYAILSQQEYVPMDEAAFTKERADFEKVLRIKKQIEHFGIWFSDLKRRAGVVSNIK